MKSKAFIFVLLLMVLAAETSAQYSFNNRTVLNLNHTLQESFLPQESPTFRPVNPAIPLITSYALTIGPVLMGGLASLHNTSEVYWLSFGLLIGPSTGYIFINDWPTIYRGIAIRGGSVLLGLLAFGAAWDGNEGMSIILLSGAAVVATYGIFHDLFHLPAHVRKYNETQSAKISFSPGFNPATRSVGLNFRVSF